MQPLPQFLGRDWPQHIKIVRARYLATVQGGQEWLVDLNVHLSVKPAPQPGRMLGQAIGHDLSEVVQRAGIRHRQMPIGQLHLGGQAPRTQRRHLHRKTRRTPFGLQQVKVPLRLIPQPPGYELRPSLKPPTSRAGSHRRIRQ